MVLRPTSTDGPLAYAIAQRDVNVPVDARRALRTTREEKRREKPMRFRFYTAREARLRDREALFPEEGLPVTSHARSHSLPTAATIQPVTFAYETMTGVGTVLR